MAKKGSRAGGSLSVSGFQGRGIGPGQLPRGGLVHIPISLVHAMCTQLLFLSASGRRTGLHFAWKRSWKLFLEA